MGKFPSFFVKNAAMTVDYSHSGREINIRPLSNCHRRFSQTLRQFSVLKALHQQMVLVHSQHFIDTDIGFRDTYMTDEKTPTPLYQEGARNQVDIK